MGEGKLLRIAESAKRNIKQKERAITNPNYISSEMGEFDSTKSSIFQLTSRSSTSKIKFALGGITWPAPLLP